MCSTRKAARQSLPDDLLAAELFGPVAVRCDVMQPPTRCGLAMQADAARIASAAQAARITNPRVLQVMPPIDCNPLPLEPCQFISRDALAHLLHMRGLSTIPDTPLLVDVRRHDEVALYGMLPESKHIPAEDLAFVLAAPDETFSDFALFEPPKRSQLLAFISRKNKRAEFAAALALDHGVVLASALRYCCTMERHCARCVMVWPDSHRTKGCMPPTWLHSVPCKAMCRHMFTYGPACESPVNSLGLDSCRLRACLCVQRWHQRLGP
jgi:rhodanese-related sulfurtransferase